MVPNRSDDADRHALIRLRDSIAAGRPPGLVARVRRWFRLRQANGVLEYEDARRSGIDVIAPLRRRAIWGVAAIMALNAARAVLDTAHALTAGRVVSLLAIAGGLTALFVPLSALIYRRQSAAIERQYREWLERARALPPADATSAKAPPDAAV